MITATELRDLWEIELRDEAQRLTEPEPHPWEELAYMRWHVLRANIPVIKPNPERTWLWSDLHLGDDTMIFIGRRPFATVGAMKRQLIASWQRTVKPDDLIICLGDVAHPDFWNDPRHIEDVKCCPGRRRLIMGNHDIRQGEQLGAARIHGPGIRVDELPPSLRSDELPEGSRCQRTGSVRDPGRLVRA